MVLLLSEFLPTKIRNVQENGVREAHEVPTRQGGALQGLARVYLEAGARVILVTFDLAGTTALTVDDRIQTLISSSRF